MREWTIHAGAAVCGVAIAGSMCLVELDRYGDAMDGAERNTRNAARHAAAHAAQVFADVRSSLQGVLSIREDVADGRIGDRTSVEHLLDAVRGDTDLIRSVGWTDENGIQRARSPSTAARPAARPRPMDMSSREHFRYFRDQAVAGADEPLHVSAPFRTRRTGEWVMIASLPIRESGAFAGVVGVALDPAYFARIYEGIDLGHSAVATLYRTDGTILSRLPDIDGWAGKTGAPGGLPFDGSLGGRRSGTLHRAETGTTPSRIVSYEAVAGLPLFVAFGVATDEALAPFFDRLRITLAAVALALAFLAGCAWFAHLWIRLRRRADAELARSEGRYRTLSEMSPVGVFRTDADGRCVYTNERWRSFAALAPEEALGDGWVQALHPDDRETVHARWSAAMRRDGHFAAEYRFRDPAGRVTWLFGQTSAERDAAGRVTGYVGTVTDITDLKRQEAALRDSEERFRTLVNTVDGVVWESAPAAGLDVTFVSHKAVDLLGYPVAQWLEPGFRAARTHDEDRERLLAVYEEHIAAPTPFDAEYRLVARDGRVVWVHDYVNVTAEDGRATRLRGILVDVTRQKTAEDSLQRAQKMEAIGQLTGGIAHDFNNLLAVVMGNAELLAELPMSETDREFLRSIEIASERGATLTAQLLAFGRRSPLNPVVLDLNEVVHDLDRLMRRTLPATIQIIHLLATDLWPVTADRAQLDNALLNLAINARDAMPRGGRITIRTENVWRDPTVPELDANGAPPADEEIPRGAYVAISLTDTGSGMGPDVIAQAFEPYFTTKGPGEGSGLGLSMVYGFARQSGGTASIESAEGAGTTVTLLLPRAGEAGVADDDGESDASRDGPPRAQPGERILVLEDDPAVRTTLLSQLRALGYEAESAHNGETALAVLRASPGIALLLTDVTLPGRLSGIQTAAAAQRANAGLEVVFISGYPRGTSFDDLPAHAVLLTKPVARAELAEALRSAFDRAERRSGRMAC